jgi:hypothetical protein
MQLTLCHQKKNLNKRCFSISRPVNWGISSLTGERDNWELGLDDHDDSAIATNDLYNKAT